MYDDCPDHGLPGTRVCPSCVRPLCRKCKVAPSGRCAECTAAQGRDQAKASEHVPGRGASGTGRLVLIILLLAGLTLVMNWKGCAGLPHDIVWLK